MQALMVTATMALHAGTRSLAPLVVLLNLACSVTMVEVGAGPAPGNLEAGGVRSVYAIKALGRSSVGAPPLDADTLGRSSSAARPVALKFRTAVLGFTTIFV